ncbi:MAG: pentapeptide repeat-containing protein [Candidatus Cybelea sp.]
MNSILAAIVLLASSLATTGGLPAHCSGCSFAGRDLHGAGLANVEYAGVDLSHANLRDADLRGARLAGVDFYAADLRGADFSKAKLAGVDLHQAQLSGAIFTGATLAGVNLRDVFDGVRDIDARGLLHKCEGCDARGAVIAGFDLSGVSIVGGDFREARARRVRLIGAELEGVDFAQADLRDAVLHGAKLCSRNADDPRVQCIDLRGADVRGADFRGALLCQDDREPRNCRPVDAATLREGSRSSLAGAILP